MKPSFIILHHSAELDGHGLDTQGIRRFHTELRKYNDIGYHVLCEMASGEYEIILGRMWDENGAHCPGMNTKSLGICCVGNFEEHQMPDAQYAKLLRLIRSLMHIFKIPAVNVHPHRRHKATLCPGKFFPYDRLIKELSNVQV